jgi:hypothetical protein
MNKRSKPVRLVVTTALAAVALGTATTGTAQAWLNNGPDVQYPSAGGKWTYGFWDAKVRSYYYHPSRCHGSTVVYNGEQVRSIDTAGGRTSTGAEKWAYQAWYNDDAYYYRTC